MTTTNVSDLTPVELFALSKIDGKKVRKMIQPGHHEISMVVRVRGTLGVGEDYVQTISPAVPWRDLFLAALSQMAPAHRRMFVEDYLRHSEEGLPAIVNRDALEAEVEDMAREIMGTTERVCNGKTRASLTVEALDAIVLEGEAA